MSYAERVNVELPSISTRRAIRGNGTPSAATGRRSAPESMPTEEEIAAGGRNVIVAFMPDLSPYGDLFVNNLGPDKLYGKHLELSESLRKLASEMSGAGPGDVYYDAHLTYLYRLTRTFRDGASIVCGGPVGQALRGTGTASGYPDALFSTLDADVQLFAREAQGWLPGRWNHVTTWPRHEALRQGH